MGEELAMVRWQGRHLLAPGLEVVYHALRPAADISARSLSPGTIAMVCADWG